MTVFCKLHKTLTATECEVGKDYCLKCEHISYECDNCGTDLCWWASVKGKKAYKLSNDVWCCSKACIKEAKVGYMSQIVMQV